MNELTKLEEVVMIAIWNCIDEAYGVNIKKQVHEITGKEYFYNTLYTTFDQLVRKGFIVKDFGEPTAVRGGKRKVFFKITNEGLAALEKAFERQERVWAGIKKETFQKGLSDA
jgi:DNA-binding PadR family transcriptional regulator